MSLPLNMRFRVIQPDQMDGLPVIMAAFPNNPLDPMSVNQVPVRLELELIDPDDGKPKWYEIPFFNPPRSAILADPPTRRKRN